MDYYALKETEMVTITDVLPNSRAQKAGIEAGDKLVSINKKEINDVLDYRFYLASKSVTLIILRDGKQKKFKIKIPRHLCVGVFLHINPTKPCIQMVEPCLFRAVT